MQSLAVTFPCFCASVAKKNIPFCRLFLTTEHTEGDTEHTEVFSLFYRHPELISGALNFCVFCASVAKKNILFCRLFLTTERTEGAQSTVVTLNLFQGLISSVFMSFRGKIFNHQEHREEAPSAVIFFIIGKMLK